MTTGLWDRLAAGESVLMPGVWDALSARLAAEAGFSTVFLSGYCVSGTQLALPDYGLTELVGLPAIAETEVWYSG